MNVKVWQWLAVTTLILACGWWVWDLRHPRNSTTVTGTTPINQPAR